MVIIKFGEIRKVLLYVAREVFQSELDRTEVQCMLVCVCLLVLA